MNSLLLSARSRLGNRLQLKRRYRLERASATEALHPTLEPAGAQLDVVITGSTLTLSGELDISTRDLLERAGRELTPSDIDVGAAEVVVITAALDFIDAAGIGELVALSNTLGAAGRRVRIQNPSRRLRRLSALCDLDATFGFALARAGGVGAATASAARTSTTAAAADADAEGEGERGGALAYEQIDAV